MPVRKPSASTRGVGMGSAIAGTGTSTRTKASSAMSFAPVILLSLIATCAPRASHGFGVGSGAGDGASISSAGSQAPEMRELFRHRGGRRNGGRHLPSASSSSSSSSSSLLSASRMTRMSVVMTTKTRTDEEESMIDETQTPSSSSSSLSEPKNQGNDDGQDDDTDRIEYDWKKQWYALTYSSYVPDPSTSSEVTPAAVFGHPLVLWRERDGGPIYCADDVCPHRSAALSEGRVRNGTIECLYHGWQFAGGEGGTCRRIPQLESGADVPRRACLRMRTCRVSEGMVWVWMGDGEHDDKDENKTPLDIPEPPKTNVLDEDGLADGWNVYDFMIDLPYDHTYLVENLLDPAHVAISHDRTPGGGRRELAEGYDMHVNETSYSSRGFTGKFRLLSRQSTGGPYTDFEFEAPGIVRNKFHGDIRGRTVQFGAALHCMPLGLGRSRLFFRTYNRGLPPIATFLLRNKPKWLHHLNSCKVLEQDVGLITTQEDHFRRHRHGGDGTTDNRPRRLADDFLLIRSSDAYVGAYRRWLDRVGHGMPWFQGLVSSSGHSSSSVRPDAHVPPGTLPPSLAAATHRASNQDVVETRYHRHVMHCPVTRNALRNVRRIKMAFAALSGAALALLCGSIPPLLAAAASSSSPSPVVSTAAAAAAAATASTLPLLIVKAASFVLPLGLIGAVAMHFLEREFHVSFKRKDQLRKESGLVP